MQVWGEVAVKEGEKGEEFLEKSAKMLRRNQEGVTSKPFHSNF